MPVRLNSCASSGHQICEEIELSNHPGVPTGACILQQHLHDEIQLGFIWLLVIGGLWCRRGLLIDLCLCQYLPREWPNGNTASAKDRIISELAIRHHFARIESRIGYVLGGLVQLVWFRRLVLL